MFKVFFRRNEAIKELQNQLRQINDLTPFDYDTYKTITARIVKKYFGEGSDLYHQISTYNFSDFNTLPEELRATNIEGKRALKKIEVASFIETCLLVIEKDGIIQQNRIFMPDALELV